jgi:hypothetical protein
LPTGACVPPEPAPLFDPPPPLFDGAAWPPPWLAGVLPPPPPPPLPEPLPPVSALPEFDEPPPVPVSAEDDVSVVAVEVVGVVPAGTLLLDWGTVSAGTLAGWLLELLLPPPQEPSVRPLAAAATQTMTGTNRRMAWCFSNEASAPAPATS